MSRLCWGRQKGLGKTGRFVIHLLNFGCLMILYALVFYVQSLHRTARVKFWSFILHFGDLCFNILAAKLGCCHFFVVQPGHNRKMKLKKIYTYIKLSLSHGTI